VPEAIEYEQFESTARNGAERAGASPPGGEADLSRLSDIPMELSVEIGRTHMTVGETLDLRVGSVVALERLAGETADLLVNGNPVARGEVVVIDEQYGLRLTEILDRHGDGELGGLPEQDGARARGAASGAGLDDREEGEAQTTKARRRAGEDDGESSAVPPRRQQDGTTEPAAPEPAAPEPAAPQAAAAPEGEEHVEDAQVVEDPGPDAREG